MHPLIKPANFSNGRYIKDELMDELTCSITAALNTQLHTEDEDAFRLSIMRGMSSIVFH